MLEVCANKMTLNRKAEIGGMTITVLIGFVLAVIILLVAWWFGGKAVGLGKVVTDAVV